MRRSARNGQAIDDGKWAGGRRSEARREEVDEPVGVWWRSIIVWRSCGYRRRRNIGGGSGIINIIGI